MSRGPCFSSSDEKPNASHCFYCKGVNNKRKTHMFRKTHGLSMTMTMTLKEVQHLSMEAWPYRRECRGHDPAKKNLFC